MALLDSLKIKKSNSESTQLTNSINDSALAQQCEIHCKNIEVFCETDKALLCVNCILESYHKNHTLTAINKVIAWSVIELLN